MRQKGGSRQVQQVPQEDLGLVTGTGQTGRCQKPAGAFQGGGDALTVAPG
jgi:hypothetical protein